MADKTITITAVPDIADWRERVLAMANAAKKIAWGGNGDLLPDDSVFIRAAMAVDQFVRGDTRQTCALMAALTAGSFFTDIDDDPAARLALLEERLDDPAQTATPADLLASALVRLPEVPRQNAGTN
jgi:hypothetical protein